MEESGNTEAESALQDNTAGVLSNDKDSGSSTAREDQKKGPHVRPKKKSTAFVASSASRRRPAMPRRSSSQSSNGAPEMGSKEGASSLGGSQSSVPTILEQSEQPLGSKKADREGVSNNTQTTKKRLERQPNITDREAPKLSAKAAGKRPERRPNVGRAHVPEPQTTTEVQHQTTRTEADRGTSANRKDNNGKSATSGANSSKGSQKAPHSDSKDSKDRSRPRATHNMNRSASDIGYKRSGSREASRSISHLSGSFTQAKVDTSVVGQGTITGFTDNVFNEAKTSNESNVLSCSVGEAAESSRPTAQFSPTKPTNTTSIPLARSKSQLTLLLDRQGERRPKR
ncbi:hypothetical protein GGR57DRAFT_223716 [Xylariaceae sp. FL1272]|nr:hypothetical protein GGR57DRAFT_223716 [Xylariaceae sp. FL1272]